MTQSKTTSKNPGRAAADDVLALLVARGVPDSTAAEQANVSVRTVSRRKADPTFKQKVRKIRDEMFDKAIAVLEDAAVEAVKTLTSLLGEDTPPQTRAAAAASILVYLTRFREQSSRRKKKATPEELERRREDSQQRAKRLHTAALLAAMNELEPQESPKHDAEVHPL